MGLIAQVCRDIYDIDLNFAAAEEARKLFSEERPCRVVCVGDGKTSITGHIFACLFPKWWVWSVDSLAKCASKMPNHYICRGEAVSLLLFPYRPTLIVAVHSHAPLPHIGDAAIAIPCCVKQTRPGRCITKRVKAIHGTRHRTIKIWLPSKPESLPEEDGSSHTGVYRRGRTHRR